MGLLDSLLGTVLGQGVGQQGSQGNQGNAALMQLALQLLAGRGQGGGGGLMDLIQQFQRAGLGSQMNSWIGTGQNMPISPEQLTQVFGRGQLEQMAASTGMDTGLPSGPRPGSPGVPLRKAGAWTPLSMRYMR